MSANPGQSWGGAATATTQLPRFAQRQLLNYLTVTKLELGLILHFGPEAKSYRMVSTQK